MSAKQAKMKSVITRFRAYQLGTSGSSFSFFADGHFTLIEGRLTDLSRVTLAAEMQLCGAQLADTLHITSWDADHCAASELEELLEMVRPAKIECPGYVPHTDNGKKCLKIIREHRKQSIKGNREAALNHITPEYVTGLSPAKEVGFNDVFYGPRSIDDSCPNNNSTIKLFRGGSFNVLSLGDVEDPNISARLRRDKYMRREVDVMILAHHGADNGFTNKQLLERLQPKLAVCSSNYGNQYDHPPEQIRTLLYENDVRLMTTKTGDVVVLSTNKHDGDFRAVNLIAESTKISSAVDFNSKKSHLLSFNLDTIRQLYAPKPAHPKK